MNICWIREQGNVIRYFKDSYTRTNEATMLTHRIQWQGSVLDKVLDKI